jgi:hypothetical protein
MDSVWIVKNDDDEVLGIFATEDEAQRYAEEVGKALPDGALFTSFDLPWTRDEGTLLIIG